MIVTCDMGLRKHILFKQEMGMTMQLIMFTVFTWVFMLLCDSF